MSRFYNYLTAFLQIMFKYLDILECCDTVTISSDNPSFDFDNLNAFGTGTYTKSGTDSNGKTIYRNNYYNSFGLGDFILYFDNGFFGVESWVVSFYLIILVT